ncbi:MAG: amino acid racemase [Chloroflexota bacterium]
MSHRTVGVIGGVGPGGTAVFYTKVVRQYAERQGGDQPPLLIYSLPMEAQIESAMLNGATAGPEVDGMIAMLDAAVNALARAGASTIVMPCNTLQGYLPPLVARAGLSYIHLIAETVSRVKQCGHARVTVICTAAMRALRLYQNEMDAQSVKYVMPAEDEQAGINQAILDTLHHAPDPSARLRPVIRRLERDADSILLGCSDLTAFDDPAFTRLPVIDAMSVLAEATVKYLSDPK